MSCHSTEQRSELHTLELHDFTMESQSHPGPGREQNTRYGSRPRTHTRSIPPDPYLDPYPMILHDPYPWSIPLIHTPDPYPWSVPLSRWRKTDAGPDAAFYPNTASGPRTATPVATTVASTAASAASAAWRSLPPLPPLPPCCCWCCCCCPY